MPSIFDSASPPGLKHVAVRDWLVALADGDEDLGAEILRALDARVVFVAGGQCLDRLAGLDVDDRDLLVRAAHLLAALPVSTVTGLAGGRPRVGALCATVNEPLSNATLTHV